MNRKQLVVLWVGVFLFVIAGLWPPSIYTQVTEEMESSWMEFKFILSGGANPVLWQNLLTEWLIIAALTAAGILTLRDYD